MKKNSKIKRKLTLVIVLLFIGMALSASTSQSADQQDSFQDKVKFVTVVQTFSQPVPPTSFYLKWSSTSNTLIAMGPPITADTNNDGVIDSLFIGGIDYGDWLNDIYSRILLRLDSNTGQEIWRIKNQGAVGYPRGSTLNPLELYDVTGDGVPELFTAWADLNHQYGMGMACIDVITHQPIWVNWDLKPMWHHFVIIADKQTNVPYIYFNGHNVAGDTFSMNKVDARNGALITKIMPSPGSCNGGLSAADINGDGNVEIIISAHASTAYPTTCYDTDLNILWQANFATYSSTQCGQLVDVNNDGILDVVNLRQCGSGQMTGGLNVINGATGQRIDSMSSNNLGIDAHEHGSIYDVDGDGYYEITTGYSGPSHVVKIQPNPYVIGRIGTTEEFSNPPNFINLVGDNTLEIACAGRVFSGLPPYSRIQTSPSYTIGRSHTNDITGDGKMEVFGMYIGQRRVDCYGTNVGLIPGINTFTAMYGYRRLNSPIAYDPCPGTYWYTWDHSIEL